MNEVAKAIDTYNCDESVGAIIITGSERAFAAGADIKEMKDNTFAQNLRSNFLSEWTRVAQSKKPVIAAVNGFAVSITTKDVPGKKWAENFRFSELSVTKIRYIRNFHEFSDERRCVLAGWWV